MGDSARVESVDALKQFRVALVKFAESANVALADAEGELHSTLTWLENEQYNFWQSQIRKRHDLLERAKEALRMKTLFKDSSGRTPSAVEEQKAVRVAMAREEEAHQKFANVKKYTRVLQQAIQDYKGSTQRFATTVQCDIPVALSMLNGMVETLEQYVALSVGDTDASSPASSSSTPPPIETQDDEKPAE